jgi:hypothetical protein
MTFFLDFRGGQVPDLRHASAAQAPRLSPDPGHFMTNRDQFVSCKRGGCDLFRVRFGRAGVISGT